MNRQSFLKIASAVFTLVPASISAQTSDRPDRMRFVPDVVGQFQALTDRPDPFGMYIGSSPDPSSCKHYQGVVRVQGADGTSFLLVSRSGNVPPIPILPDGEVCNDSDGETHNGQLIVFRMGSRNQDGERMRSNRLRKGEHLNTTSPNSNDISTNFFTVVDGGLVYRHGEGGVPAKVYQHPGGMQVVGNVLALAVEHPRTKGSDADCAQCSFNPSSEACLRCNNYERATNQTMVMFFDVSNPEDPAFLSQFPLVDGEGQPRQVAGTVAITPLPDGHYLMMVTGGAHNPSLWFYRSTSTDLKSTDLSWLYVDGWHADTARFIPNFSQCSEESEVGANGFCLSGDEQYLEQNWPDGNDGHTHQTLQFLRQGDVTGPLYLAGARGKYTSNTSTIDLYRVDCGTSACESGDIKLKQIVTRDLTPFPNTGGEQLASFAAASTFYVSPSGELLFYATEHDNDGPGNKGTVKAGEWRHKNVVREGSPTLLPTARVDGPYEVDEGASINLTGTATPPITKAWVQLFHDTDLRSYSAVIDFDDSHLDDFDDFSIFEYLFRPPLQPFSHHNKFRSLSWFAPPGCSMQAVDRESGNGVQTLTLDAGTSIPQEALNLASVLNDAGTDNMDQRIDGVAFLPNCANYYSKPFNLLWDLDLNGTYESTGQSVPFFPAVDGPSQLSVPVLAQHPSGGLTNQTTAFVSVRNVPPNITNLSVMDSLGRVLGSDIPFAVEQLEYSVKSTFTDPGVQDHQTATLNLGDGTIVPSSGFDSFTDSFGGTTGQLSKRHIYNTPGTYSINLEVVDDDGGPVTAGLTIQVVSLAQSIQWVIDDIDLRLSTATNTNVIQALRDAREALAGDHTGLLRRRGALDELNSGNFVNALLKVRDAIKALERSEAAGMGNLNLLKSALGLVGEVTAQKAYQRALASVGTPNSYEEQQLHRVRTSITAGQARLVAAAYVAALEEFKEAASRAACLEAFLCINLGF
jgi:hypothetical protein